MNIRNIMFMFIVFCTTQISNAIQLEIKNNVSEPVLVRVNDDKLREIRLDSHGDRTTIDFMPDKLGVRKEGGLLHESRMQTALEAVKADILAHPNDIRKRSIIIKAGTGILHPFAFDTGIS